MRDIVKCNTLCYERDVRIRQKLHKRRIAKMAPTSKSNAKNTMDFTRPRSLDMQHIQRKTSTRWKEDEEYARIERHNHILMSKMDKIFASSVARSRDQEKATMFTPGVRLNPHQVFVAHIIMQCSFHDSF